MSENYNSPERQYRDPVAAGNLLTRINVFGSSEADLKQIIDLDPALLDEAEAALAGYAQQQEHKAIADTALANSLEQDTLSADAPAMEAPDTAEGIVAGEESMLADTAAEEPAPWLAEEPPLWGGEE